MSGTLDRLCCIIGDSSIDTGYNASSLAVCPSIESIETLMQALSTETKLEIDHTLQTNALVVTILACLHGTISDHLVKLSKCSNCRYQVSYSVLYVIPVVVSASWGSLIPTWLMAITETV